MTSRSKRFLVSRDFSFHIMRCGLVLLAISLCGAVPEISYEQRTDAFRRLLFELRFQPLRSFGELQENPSESLFIMLGDPRCLSRKGFFPEGLRSFVEQGGAVLIATDRETKGRAGEELSKLAGVKVAGDLLACSRPDPAENYDESLNCPFVQPIADTSGLKGSKNVLGTLAAFIRVSSRPELFRNPHSVQQDLRVATNNPSYLKRTNLREKRWLIFPGGIYRLASLPASCTPDAHSDDFSDSSLPDELLFAVSGRVGKGRVLVLADHSIFINRMILPRDNGNMEFAANCLHWLRGGVSTPMEALGALRSGAERGNEVRQLLGQRNKVLFWDDGVIRDNFEVPLKTVPLPPPAPSEPAIVAAIDKTIAQLEANDSFNRALLDQIDDLPGGRPRVIRYAVYLLTLAAALFLVYRFVWRSRHRLDLAVPSLAKTLRDHEPRASLLDQRRRALLRLGNVWEMGHRLAQEVFESAGVALPGASRPRVRMLSASRWRRWRVQRRVFRLWRLARGDAPAFLSPAALQRLLCEVEQLKSALADGTIVLSAD